MYRSWLPADLVRPPRFQDVPAAAAAVVASASVATVSPGRYIHVTSLISAAANVVALR